MEVDNMCDIYDETTEVVRCAILDGIKYMNVEEVNEYPNFADFMPLEHDDYITPFVAASVECAFMGHMERLIDLIGDIKNIMDVNRDSTKSEYIKIGERVRHEIAEFEKIFKSTDDSIIPLYMTTYDYMVKIVSMLIKTHRVVLFNIYGMHEKGNK